MANNVFWKILKTENHLELHVSHVRDEVVEGKALSRRISLADPPTYTQVQKEWETMMQEMGGERVVNCVRYSIVLEDAPLNTISVSVDIELLSEQIDLICEAVQGFDLGEEGRDTLSGVIPLLGDILGLAERN